VNYFFKLGQVIGITSGIFTCLLWVLMMWELTATFSFSIASYAVVFIMVLMAIIAMVASLKGRSGVLVVIFGISFFPIGLYVLAVPHWIHWVGLANIGFLLAGIVIWRFRPSYNRGSD